MGRSAEHCVHCLRENNIIVLLGMNKNIRSCYLAQTPSASCDRLTLGQERPSLIGLTAEQMAKTAPPACYGQQTQHCEQRHKKAGVGIVPQLPGISANKQSCKNSQRKTTSKTVSTMQPYKCWPPCQLTCTINVCNDAKHIICSALLPCYPDSPIPPFAILICTLLGP